MGSKSFLAGSSADSPQSVEESLFQLQNCSTIFLASWLGMPSDLQRAGRVSNDAMSHLDHIVNEILRARDTQKSLGTYNESNLKRRLDISSGLMLSPVSREQQQAITNAGAGEGALPDTGISITLEKLLNKIKHRHHASTNFRIDDTGRHILLMNVDKLDHSPDCIVEFDVLEFCEHCRMVVPHI